MILPDLQSYTCCSDFGGYGDRLDCLEVLAPADNPLFHLRMHRSPGAWGDSVVNHPLSVFETLHQFYRCSCHIARQQSNSNPKFINPLSAQVKHLLNINRY